jgi:asparagine synthase (glutamine-hydrolysing)
MSGIVAIVNTNGTPCDAERLRDLTRALVFRGPDGNATTVCGEAGFGAALLRSTHESATERQPLSLDGTVYIVADCRVDDRGGLIAALRRAGQPTHSGAPDVELILRAYLAWGTRCVERLIGDFAFVIWDGRDRTLFAARDHFGVKPCFYAQVGDLLIVSNTLGCIRRHPDVPSDVNEAVIGDFLLFGSNYFPDLSAFRHIQRLPPAHWLRCCNRDLRIERYWQVPAYDEPLRLRRGEVVEGFREVLGAAVSDRLRGGVAALELSGGVDSTTVVATACDVRRRNATDVSLTAWTFDSRPLIPADREFDLARLTASALGIPQVRRSFDGYALFRDATGQCVTARVEPQDLSVAAVSIDYFFGIAESSRVLLTGVGGDGVFRAQALGMQEFLRPSGWFTTARGILGYAVRRRTLPPLAIRTRMKRLAGIPLFQPPPMPGWIEPEFAREQCLEERWRDQWVPPWNNVPGTALRPGATQGLRALWAQSLERYDAEWSGAPLDACHPYFDVRVIEFLMRTPPAPWFWGKELPRRACLASVPPEIRNRRKTVLAGHQLHAAFERGEHFPANWQSHPALRRYVRSELIPEMPQSASQIPDLHLWSVSYVVSLSLWLQNLSGEYSNEKRGHANVQRAATGTTA